VHEIDLSINSTDMSSNILSDVPTNSQLIIRLLRDAEHKRRPLSLPDDDDDDDDDEEEDESEEGDIKSKMGYKIRSMKTKVNSGLRSKVRQAWDKAGSVKEEVSQECAAVCETCLTVHVLARASRGSPDTKRWTTRARQRRARLAAVTDYC